MTSWDGMGRRPAVARREDSSMSQGFESSSATFIDRRSYGPAVESPPVERRQFSNSHDGLSSDARELAVAIDEYKVRHRRRFITYEEMLEVVTSLGYHK
jgi:hypothetical protein